MTMVRFGIGLCVWLFAASCTLVAQRQVLHPEDLAGQWEASDEQGGEIGMNIWLTTAVARSVKNLVGVPQTLYALMVGIYVRSATEIEPHGFNSFSSRDGAATWDGEHLQFNLVHSGDLPEVHVALTWHPADKTWTGLFERAAYKNQAITLRRPASNHARPNVGTWIQSSGAWSSCLHVTQRRDGTFTAWSDGIQIPGRVRYANGLQPSDQVFERYGEPARVKVTGADQLTVELGAYAAMCCSHPFTAKLSDDGNALVGERLAGANQALGPVRWTRVQGDSCIPAASRP